jgi:SanA protein
LVFGQKRFTVVTQSFQSDRALLLAASAGADAVAYAADAPGFFVAPGTYFREIFARPLALYDLFLGKTYPKYL